MHFWIQGLHASSFHIFCSVVNERELSFGALIVPVLTVHTQNRVLTVYTQNRAGSECEQSEPGCSDCPHSEPGSDCPHSEPGSDCPHSELGSDCPHLKLCFPHGVATLLSITRCYELCCLLLITTFANNNLDLIHLNSH